MRYKSSLTRTYKNNIFSLQFCWQMDENICVHICWCEQNRNKNNIIHCWNITWHKTYIFLKMYYYKNIKLNVFVEFTRQKHNKIQGQANIVFTIFTTKLNITYATNWYYNITVYCNFVNIQWKHNGLYGYYTQKQF